MAESKAEEPSISVCRPVSSPLTLDLGLNVGGHLEKFCLGGMRQVCPVFSKPVSLIFLSFFFFP